MTLKMNMAVIITSTDTITVAVTLVRIILDMNRVIFLHTYVLQL